MKKIVSILLLSLFILPLMVSAEATAPTPIQAPTITTVNGLYGLLKNIVSWFFAVVLVVAVIFFIYAGFIYITASGDSGKTEQARNMIIYAVIGVAVALMAQAFIYIAANFVGQTGVSPF